MNARTPVMTGGCQCGAVRFALYAEPEPASLCHCRMCQKATGGLFGAFAGVALADFAWTRGEPAMFRSSGAVERGFCANCGTPLSFAFLGQPRISLSLGCFDEPARLPPARQIWTENRVPWLAGLAALPDRGSGGAPGAALAHIAATNHQHPDHDTEQWTPRPSEAAQANGPRR